MLFLRLLWALHSPVGKAKTLPSDFIIPIISVAPAIIFFPSRSRQSKVETQRVPSYDERTQWGIRTRCCFVFLPTFDLISACLLMAKLLRLQCKEYKDASLAPLMAHKLYPRGIIKRIPAASNSSWPLEPCSQFQNLCQLQQIEGGSLHWNSHSLKIILGHFRLGWV